MMISAFETGYYDLGVGQSSDFETGYYNSDAGSSSSNFGQEYYDLRPIHHLHTCVVTGAVVENVTNIYSTKCLQQYQRNQMSNNNKRIRRNYNNKECRADDDN
uniref:Uncharacterized protein n=1 Tax=Cucumis melo TaxID=3656 RepID=A0A9I9E962_CUCME